MLPPSSLLSQCWPYPLKVVTCSFAFSPREALHLPPIENQAMKHGIGGAKKACLCSIRKVLWSLQCCGSFPKFGYPNIDANILWSLFIETLKKVPLNLGNSHMSSSLNSLKGGYIGDYIGGYYRAY